DLEDRVGGVEVTEVLQGDAVGAAVAGEDEARPADADGDVRLDGLLDLEAVRQHGGVAVRVDDLEVVEAVRRAGQVKGGDDLRVVQNLQAGGFVLREAGHHQFDDGLGVELGAFDGGGNVGPVAALIGV